MVWAPPNQKSWLRLCLKLGGRVGEGFYAEYPNNSTKQAFFSFRIHSTVLQAEVLAISEATKELLLKKMLNHNIVALVDSQLLKHS